MLPFCIIANLLLIILYSFLSYSHCALMYSTWNEQLNYIKLKHIIFIVVAYEQVEFQGSHLHYHCYDITRLHT